MTGALLFLLGMATVLAASAVAMKALHCGRIATITDIIAAFLARRG